MTNAILMQPPPRKAPFFLQVVAPGLAVTGFLWLTSAHPVNAFWLPLAFLLFSIPWYTYCRWNGGAKRDFPLFPLVAGMYFVEYVLPLFWGSGTMKTLIGDKVLTGDSMQLAAFLALVGVLALWAGKSVGLGRKLGLRNRVELSEAPFTWNYLRIVLVAGTLSSNLGQYAMGEGGRHIIILLQSVVPIVAFALLYRNYLQGKADRSDKIVLLLFTIARFFFGLSSGWLGSFVLFGIVCVAVYIHERRRIPKLALLGALLFILFFQPSKGVFRRTFWLSGGRDAGTIEKVTYWGSESFRMWSEAPSNPKVLKDLGGQVLSRLSLLEYSANVMELTPEVVPFQNFHLYEYLAVTLIPRFMWPEKPSFNDANQWYQVNYGLTDRSELGKVSMAVGILTEGYISFGWIGTIAVMFLVGAFLDWFQYSFLDQNSGLLLNAIGVAIFPSFLSIESQMAQYLAGTIQALALSVFVMAPVMKLYPRAREGSPMPQTLDSPQFANNDPILASLRHS
jgi:hypothetical protein